MTALDYKYYNQPTENGCYQVSITAANATGYTLQAAPQGAQTADTFCGTLTIDTSDTKTESGSAASWKDC